MTLDLEIIYDLLTAASTRDLAPLDKHDVRALNRHRELLLTNYFVTGNSSYHTPPKGQPIVQSYSHLNLTESGERLLTLSNRVSLWQRAKDAIESDDSSWSLPDFCTYLESQSTNDRDA